MSYALDWIAEGMRIGGYAGGADWVVIPSGGSIMGTGFTGEQASATYAWAVAGPRNGYGDDRIVVVLDLAAKRIVRRVPFKKLVSDALLASRDGTRLYAVAPSIEGPGAEIVVVDAHTGAVDARHLIPCNHVSLYRQRAVETMDGDVRLPVLIAGEDQSSRAAIATLNPRSGDVSLASLPHGGRFIWLSPRGRFAFRPSLASLSTRDEASIPFAGIGFGPKTRFYGSCLQLWDMDPQPRFLRTIPVAWLTYDELPDDARRRQKRKAYEAIEAACKGQGPDEHVPPPLTAELYPSDQRGRTRSRSIGLSPSSFRLRSYGATTKNRSG